MPYNQSLDPTPERDVALRGLSRGGAVQRKLYGSP